MKKIISLMLVLLIIFGCLVGCGDTSADPTPETHNNENHTEEQETKEEASGSLKWPKFGVCMLLPAPPSNEGYIHEDGSDEADIDVYEISQEEFIQYVSDCQEKGFVIDYYFDDSDYEAYNADNYCLWLDYDQDTEIMNIWIYYDEDYGEEEDEETTEAESEAITEAATEAPTEAKIETGLRSDFKEAMDSYEAFMDEYVAFIKKYKANPSDLSLLMEYATFMEEYAEFVEDFEKWNSEDMNDAELAYYLEVNARVTKKLAEII